MSIAKEDNMMFQLSLSGLTGIIAFIVLVLLQRTDSLGETIMLAFLMIKELGKFLFTFGLLIIGVFFIQHFLAASFIIDAEKRTFTRVAL